MGKQNKQTNLTMKFTAALLFATATAGYSGYGHGKGEQVAVAGYDAPETQLLNWTKSWTSDYKKIDVDAIVTELNRRNEIAVRAVRDETFATTQGLTEEHRNAVDELIAVFEGDILALREAIQASRDPKRPSSPRSSSPICTTTTPESPSFWMSMVRGKPSPGKRMADQPPPPLPTHTSHGTPESQQRDTTTNTTPPRSRPQSRRRLTDTDRDTDRDTDTVTDTDTEHR